MPSRRDLIAMTAGEVRSYLEGQRRIILCTISAGGMPHAVPMNYGLDEAGRILITAFAKSQKVRNLERDPRATLLVESGVAYRALKAVMLQADAEVIRDPDQIAALMPLLRADSEMSASMTGGMSQQVRDSLAKRAMLRFTPFRQVSWDHGKLGEYY